MMESSSAARQSLQRIVVRHAERGEVTVVRRENRQATGGGRGGDRDVLEAGIVCAIENGAGVAGFLDAEGQDTPGIEMLDGREPAAQALRLGSGADPLAAGDAASISSIAAPRHGRAYWSAGRGQLRHFLPCRAGGTSCDGRR
jgi:hypothetical protein